MSMATTRSHKRSRSRPRPILHKPRGVIHPRVQKVGPEHFGIVSVDCAKARSKWMLCDFYGNVLIRPTVVEHNRAGLDAAVAQLRQALQAHAIHDLLVAVERTGRYHRPVQRAFAAAGFEVRIVHPFATKQFRQPSDPGYKTDDTDLAAIHRAAVNGFALRETERDETWTTLQLLIRHRRDLVFKMSLVCCQVREHLDAAFPGYAACFDKLWDSACAWRLVQHFATPRDIAAAGVAGLCRSLDEAGVRYQCPTVQRILDWAQSAAAPDLAAAQHRVIALALNDDRARKTQEILGLERQIAARLVHTPYILLLSFPGINVVSAADYAGEMGPMTDYAHHRCITGRAGLRPCRYQSDQVDHANGPLVHNCNRKLRAAILGIADNLIVCNHHFNILNHHWKAAGKDPRDIRIRVADRFCRISFHMVAGRQVFRHPSLQGRHYILDKLNAFHREHETTGPELLHDLEAAIAQLPRKEYQAEAQPLHEELEKIQAGRRRGPQLLGNILPIVLARLGVGALQSTASGEEDPR
jgi:transposase